MCIAAAIAGAGVAGLAGSAISASASGSAANAQQQAAQNATNAQVGMFNQTAGYLQPYRDFGSSLIPGVNQALGLNASLLGLQNGTINPQAIQNALLQMPGYQFQLNQGLQSVQNSAAARGLGSSGAALRSAADYATGLAQSNYNNYVNQANQYYNQLMGGVGLGENAAAGTGNAAIQTGQNIGQNMIGAGNAAAAGQIGQAAAWSNGLNNAGQLGGLYGMYGAMNPSTPSPASTPYIATNGGYLLNNPIYQP
jgi:hypothetical protein